MERFFIVEPDEARFAWRRNEEQLERYSRLDGCYVITSNIEPDRMETAEVVARYKSLQQVEKAFRTMKTTDLFVRPSATGTPTASGTRVRVHARLSGHLGSPPPSGRLPQKRPDTRQCEGDSLREIWKTLGGVKIGTLKIGAKTVEQLNSLTALQKQLLKSLGASINKKELTRLSLRI